MGIPAAEQPRELPKNLLLLNQVTAEKIVLGLNTRFGVQSTVRENGTESREARSFLVQIPFTDKALPASAQPRMVSFSLLLFPQSDGTIKIIAGRLGSPQDRKIESVFAVSTEENASLDVMELSLNAAIGETMGQAFTAMGTLATSLDRKAAEHEGRNLEVDGTIVSLDEVHRAARKKATEIIDKTEK